jgi:predicted enzyme related to lactoylglutathione lyase
MTRADHVVARFDNANQSMKVTDIAFSCYPVTDMHRARTFYEQVLGLYPSTVFGEPGGMQWTEYEIASGTLAIGAGQPEWKPSSSGCSVALEVEDFDRAIEHLRSHEVPFHLDPIETPVCRMAFILDPDGNAVCVHKRNPQHP